MSEQIRCQLGRVPAGATAMLSCQCDKVTRQASELPQAGSHPEPSRRFVVITPAIRQGIRHGAAWYCTTAKMAYGVFAFLMCCSFALPQSSGRSICL